MLQSSLGAALYLPGNTAPECPGLYSKDAHVNSSKGKIKCPSAMGVLPPQASSPEGSGREPAESTGPGQPRVATENPTAGSPMAVETQRLRPHSGIDGFPTVPEAFLPARRSGSLLLSVSLKCLICSMKHIQSQALQVGTKGKRKEFPREKQFTLPFSNFLPRCLGTPVCK